MLTADVRTEIKALVTIAAPIILSFLLLMSIGLISVLNVGRIGENELAAVGFSVTFLNILGNSWIVGMTSALDTFGTQAFGAKNFVMFSNVMQRSLFLCMMTCIPLFGLFMFNETILDAFHYDINVRNMAAPYVRVLAISLPPYGVFQVLCKFLQTQGLNNDILLSSFAGVVVHAAVVYILVFQTQLGYMGAAWATTITLVALDAILFTIIIKKRLHERVWTGWSREAFKQLWPYLKLALPGAAHICLEWWGFEVLMLLTGQLGATVSAAQTVVFNTISLLFMIPLAMSVAVTTRAGQALGAGDQVLAKLTSKWSLIMIACVQSCIGLTLIALRHQWGYIFSNSAAVVAEVASVLPVCGCYCVLDAICGVSAGILRACGKQMVGAVTNILAYWAIGIPISVVLGIQKGFGLIGMHFGLAIALSFNFTVMMTYIARINWSAQVAAAADRTRRKSDELTGVALPGAAAVELEGMDRDGDKLLDGAAMRSDDA